MICSPRQDLQLLEGFHWLNDDEKERIRGLNCARLLGWICEKNRKANYYCAYEGVQDVSIQK